MKRQFVLFLDEDDVAVLTKVVSLGVCLWTGNFQGILTFMIGHTCKITDFHGESKRVRLAADLGYALTEGPKPLYREPEHCDPERLRLQNLYAALCQGYSDRVGSWPNHSDIIRLLKVSPVERVIIEQSTGWGESE